MACESSEANYVRSFIDFYLSVQNKNRLHWLQKLYRATAQLVANILVLDMKLHST